MKKDYNGGILLWKLDRIDEAISYFIRLKDNNPDDYDAIYNLGNLYFHVEKYDQAVEYLEQYIEKIPGDENSYLLLARSYTAIEKYLLALDSYDSLLFINPQNKDAWFEKALILLTKVMDPEKGFAALSQALEMGFNDLEKIETLLDDSELIEKDRLEELLKGKNLLPGSIEEPVSSENPS